MRRALSRVHEALDAAGCRRAREWCCPAHDDHKPSLSVSVKGGKVLLRCHAGCETEDILRVLGLEWSDLFEDAPEERKIVTTYPYVDENGSPLFETVRYFPKDFKQRRPDGNGGHIWNLDGTRRVLYRLPEVLRAAAKAGAVFVVEGEKDVHAVEQAGAVATCTPMGAGKWRDEYCASLVGAKVAIIADDDKSGQEHAEQVRSSLARAGIVAPVLLPANGKDAADHLAAGLSLDELVPIVHRETADLPSPTDLSGQLEPVRFAIPELAPRKMITTLYSILGAGKSTIVYAAVGANECDQPFLGLYAFEEPQRFVVCDWENGAETVKRTLERLGVDRAALKRAHVYCDLDQERFNLDTQAGRDNIRLILERDGATCAIFDGRDSAFPHTPEIEGEKITPAMLASLRLARELDVAFVFVSQEPKAEYTDSANKLRGHTAWGQHSEQMWRIIRQGSTRLLQHTKYRGIDQRPALRITLQREGETDTGGLRLEATIADDIDRLMERRAEDARAVEAYLDEHGDQGFSALREAFKGRLGKDRLYGAFQSSERIWQPTGDRGPYSTSPKPEEGEHLAV